MKSRLLLLILLFSSACVYAQTYSGPESVEFDYANRRWLIGNTGSHQILSRDSLGVLSVLVNSTTSGPYGIEIVGDTVFCCSGGSIKGYLLSNGAPVFNLNVGGGFLNGLTHDDAGNLYATDFSAKSIIRINIAAQTYSTLASSLPNTPNGIVYDAYNNRCVFVNWGGNAPIRAIDLATNAVTTLVTTTLGSCDGITRDGIGRYYVSNWSGQSIARFDSGFVAPPATVVSSLSNPADIFYNVVDDTLGVPNAGSNTVTFHGFPSAVGIPDGLKLPEIALGPVPAVSNGFVQLRTDEPVVRLEWLDLYGRLLFCPELPVTGSFTIRLDGRSLTAGDYLLRVVTTRGEVTKRVVLIDP